MLIRIRFSVASLILMSVFAAEAGAVQTRFSQVATSPAHAARPTGRWRVKFTLSGGGEKNLIFLAKAKGAGSFYLLDTGPNDKPVADPLPAVWSELTNNRVSFSGEVELPLGTCCREIGTLTFKGRFDSNNAISGKLIFVTSVEEEESPYKFHSLVGTFTATRVLSTP
jgi:hypothetical protein